MLKITDFMDRTKVYVAASYPRKADAIKMASMLEGAGFRIASKWLEDTSADGAYAEDLSPEEVQLQSTKTAEIDFQNVSDSDMLVVITGDTKTRGGRHSEVGITLAQGKWVFLFGPRDQVFHWQPGVHSAHSRYDHLISDMKGCSPRRSDAY